MSLVAKVLVVLLLIAILLVVAVVNSPEKPEKSQKSFASEKEYRIIKTENITAAIAPLPEGSSLMYLLAAIPLVLIAVLARPP